MPDTSKRTAWRADSPSATAVSPDAATVEPPTSSCALSRKEPRVADLAKARVFGAKRGVRDDAGAEESDPCRSDLRAHAVEWV